MADVGAVEGAATVAVTQSSRDTRRLVGPLAWVALEELALRAVARHGELTVETNVRDLAALLGVGKDAVAAALSRLTKLSLVRCRTQRAGGRYAGSAYLIEIEACRRAGLLLTPALASASSCPPAPRPPEADVVRRETVHSDKGATAGGATASEPLPTPHREPQPASRQEPGPQSLFDLLGQSAASSSEPPSAIDTQAQRSARNPEHWPTTAPLPLPPSNQPDALAPEVRRGAGNASGNLNGSLEGPGQC